MKRLLLDNMYVMGIVSYAVGAVLAVGNYLGTGPTLSPDATAITVVLFYLCGTLWFIGGGAHGEKR